MGGEKKVIYLLIGPKGSGKSFVGMLMQEKFGIAFLRVESWIKDLRNHRSIHDPSYLSEAFDIIESGVEKALEEEDEIVFESTGLTDYFDQMVQHLCTTYKVVTIRLQADPTICLARVLSRDASIHINVSDDEVIAINRAVALKHMDFDYSILNNESKSVYELYNELSLIIYRSRLAL